MSFDPLSTDASQNNNSSTIQNVQPNVSSNHSSINPFLDDLFDSPNQTNQTNQSDQSSQSNQLNQSSQPNSTNNNKPSIKVTVPQKSINIVVTNDPTSPDIGSPDAQSPNQDITPTTALDVPEWWGHSLDSPINQKASYNRWGDDLDFFGTSQPSSPIMYTSDDLNNKKASSPHKTNSSNTSKGLIEPPKSDTKSKKSRSKPSTPNANNPSNNNSEEFDPNQFHFPDNTNQSTTGDVDDKKASNNNDNLDSFTSTKNNKSPSQPVSPRKKTNQPSSNNKDSNNVEDEEKQPLPKKNNSKTNIDVDTNNSTDTDKNDNTKQVNKDDQNDADSEAQKKKRRPKTDAVAEMKRGATMLKYGRHGFPHFKRFQLSHDNTKLLWYSRRKKLQETNIPISDMRDVLEGQQTEVFKQCSQPSLEKASLSIIYGSKLKTLDLVAKSAEEAQLWIKGLKGLMKARDHGKLQKVVQILVDVNYTDMTKPRYREISNDPNKNEFAQEYEIHPELVQLIDQTLKQSRKTFEEIGKMAQTEIIQKSLEYENISTLTSEIEQRLEDLEFALAHKTIELVELKRDVWVIKVDVTVLDEKLKVLTASKSPFSLF